MPPVAVVPWLSATPGWPVRISALVLPLTPPVPVFTEPAAAGLLIDSFGGLVADCVIAHPLRRNSAEALLTSDLCISHSIAVVKTQPGSRSAPASALQQNFIGPQLLFHCGVFGGNTGPASCR